MDRVYPAGGSDPSAVPGVAPGGNQPAAAALTLEVDSELFELRPDEYGGTSYTWLTGPNDGYGFGSSPTPGWSVEEHTENIRAFLAMINPGTGYIAEDGQ